MKVTVRSKPLKDGRRSLYLDIYVRTGARRTEALGLYLTGDKRADREALRDAEQVRIMRLSAVNAGRLGLPTASSWTVASYMEQVASERKHKMAAVIRSAIGQAVAAKIGKIPMSSLTVADCDKYRRHLLSKVTDGTLTSKSAETYMQVFRVALRQAKRHKVISEPLHEDFDGIRGVAPIREYLSLDEVRSLLAEPFREPYRSIITVAVLTGLRVGELEGLRHHDIEDGRLRYYQPKTGKWGKRRIADQAIDAVRSYAERPAWPGNLTDDSLRKLRKRAKAGYIWPWFPTGCACNDNLQAWLDSAGIRRNLTMHCLRHTYATLQLLAGTPIETVSALLGHSDIKTTMIYIKILDRSVDDAADRIVL